MAFAPATYATELALCHLSRFEHTGSSPLNKEANVSLFVDPSHGDTIQVAIRCFRPEGNGGTGKEDAAGASVRIPHGGNDSPRRE